MFRRAVSAVARRASSSSQHVTRRQYNFASSQYANSIFNANRPEVDIPKLRADALEYLGGFDAEAWHSDPVHTVLNGVVLSKGDEVSMETIDAFGRVNGHQVVSSTSVVDDVIEHAKNYRPSKNDYRAEFREIEAVMLSKHAGALVGNQAKDFFKQDGITEIEESLEANVVEHVMNDNLLADELAGKVTINRAPALIGCVSNFSNFLDLCRKTLRNLELGVPCIVLSRSNTTQHMYRWFQLLTEEMRARDMDLNMITYFSASIEDQRKLMKALAEESPLYLTGSREVAQKIKEIMPRTFASTGGPNTMVATEFTNAVADATRLGTLIENSGQCTAMRHLVAPNVDAERVKSTFHKLEVATIDHAAESLECAGFGALYNEWGHDLEVAAGYEKHPDLPVAFKFGGNRVPMPGIQEHWRRPYLDVTSPDTAEQLKSPEFLSELSNWFKTEQPITVAVNADDRADGFPLAKELFENTSQVVFSVGDIHEKPSLTCQARPQDGEIFGELPPRSELTLHTKAPVCVPSSTPSYNTTYTTDFLTKRGTEAASSAAVDSFVSAINDAAMKGYCVELSHYIADVASHSPNQGIGARTTLFGLQRPPLQNGMTVMRCEASTSFDDVSAFVLPFFMTNAHDSLVVSVPPENTQLVQDLEKATQGMGLNVKVEDEVTAEVTQNKTNVWNRLSVAPATASQLQLAGQHVTTLFPMGHVKSTYSDDKEFVEAFKSSAKWLKLRA